MKSLAAPEAQILPIYVDPVNGDDSRDGKSWADAMKTIPAAVAKSDTAAYYGDRRVQVTLARGTYVLDSTISLKTRTSLVGDSECDRSEIVLTAPVDEASGYGVISAGSGVVTMADPHDDFVCTVANLTISNVLIETGKAMISCGFNTAHDRWSQVVSNVVVTHCANTNNYYNWNAIGVKAGGRTLVTDCLFSNLRLSNYSIVGWCGNGGWFRDCRFENCKYGTHGGLVVCQGTKSEFSVVDGCTFVSNTTASTRSGGIQDVTVMRDCRFVDNVGQIGAWGSDKYFTDNPPQVAGCEFLRNVIKYDKAIMSFSRGGTVTNCTFTGNSSSGGCVCLLNPLEVIGCSFTSNTCSVYAPAVLRLSSSNGNAAYESQTPRVADCAFVGNSTIWSAGAVYADVPAVVEGCMFEGNYASRVGGGICATAGVTISNCVFSGNSANNGGGIGFDASAALDGALVADCVFTNNMARSTDNGNGGAGIYASLNNNPSDVCLTVRNCLFVGNILTEKARTACGSAALLTSQGSSGTARIHVESCTMVANRGACGSPSALFVAVSGPGTYVTNTVIACNIGADGNPAPAISSASGFTQELAERVGYSCLHPATSTSEDWWTDESHVTDSDTAPAFKEGTWIPARKSALCDAGVFQSWMDGAFDLQRNAEGKPFAKRVYGGSPDVGAFERASVGGLTVIIR